MSKCYKIENSPLYRMRNRRKLAILLGVPSNYFSYIHEFQYDKFSRPKPNGNGQRCFTVPVGEIKIIQKRICQLLSRIETPDWVISGKKHFSYITNAEKHQDNNFVKTMDISKFYDSVQKKYIYHMFTDKFKMAEDISRLMTNLVTYKGVLPTGSPSSQLIVYWSYSDMFEKIREIAIEKGCLFTLYVDDMIFSSKYPIERELRDSVAKILKHNGLKAKNSKDHYYQSNKLKVITGVGLLNGNKVVLNKKREEILQQYQKCKVTNNIYDIEKLNGMLCAQRQIEKDIFPEIANYIKHYETKLCVMAKNRYYRGRRKNNFV